ncbi:MAG: hypothetical protein ABI760_13065 [Ferruginibacter sp.]
MKILLPFLAFMVSAFSLKAQPDKKRGGIAVSVGAAVNYYYGRSDRNFDKFENDRVNWQINGMLGFTLGRDKNDHRTILGCFGSFGLNNANTITRIFDDQDYITAATSQSANNSSYQVEGGLFIAEMVRISTGVGQQMFNKQVIATSDLFDLEATSLKYNSTTVGFNFNVGAVGLLINCNFNYGRDYIKTIINPSAGINIRF